MKTMEEFYKEVQGNDELKKDFVCAFKAGKTEEFLKAHGCDATAADVMAFLHGSKEEAASEDDLAKVAGGGCSSFTCNDSCGCYTCEPTYCV